MSRRTIGGRYELEQPLGGGGMSSVWLAHDHELEREVAVKLLASDADRARFEREAHAVAALAHPNICQLYDYGESDEGPYMVLEYLPGGTLEDRLAGGTVLADGEALRISQEIAAGLAHAHERGLVHRDLKPANILFDAEQRAKIADFGIARIEGGNELTVAGTVLGTAAYLSPEQAAGLPASPASDVYSFGVIVFRMITGRTPFVADSAMELVRLHQEAEPPQVEELRPDAPPTLAGLAFAALAKDPADRPRDGAALLATLSGSGDRTMLIAPAAGLGDEMPPDGATQVIRRTRPRRRRLGPLVIGLGAVALALVGVAAAVLMTGSSSSDGAGTTTPASLSLPTVGTAKTVPKTTSVASSTTTPATSNSTSSPSSTRSTTTTAPTTSIALTTAPTTAPLTTAPLTTSAAATTTAPLTTSTAPLTTSTAPATTSTAASAATTTTP